MTTHGTGISGRGTPSPTRGVERQGSRSMLPIARLGSFNANWASMIERCKLVVGTVGRAHDNDASAFLNKRSNRCIHARGFLLFGKLVLNNHGRHLATDLIRASRQRLDHGAVGVRDAALLELGPLLEPPRQTAFNE